MASGPITSWQIDGETMETVADFIFFLDSKITADGDCSYEIKRRLLLGRKSMANLDSLMQSTSSLEKTLILGKIKGSGQGDDRGLDGWMASPTRWT